MKKQEYIEKYGEEAYYRLLEYNRNRYKENKEEYFARHKKWCENNQERLKEISKKSGQKWRENNRDYHKEWYSNNRENRKIQLNEYYNSHKLDYYLRYDKRKAIKIVAASHRVNSYNASDKRHGFDISSNITAEWVVDNIFSGQKCVYCGDQDWTHLGCDRIDNSKPHTADNCVCACYICNIDRKDNYTVEEFKKYRSLHPRECDIPKPPSIELSSTGALKKKAVRIG